MKLKLVHQPRRTFKSFYLMEKAIKELKEGKRTFFLIPFHRNETVKNFVNRLMELNLGFSLDNGVIKLNGNPDSWIRIVTIEDFDIIMDNYNNKEFVSDMESLNGKEMDRDVDNIFADEIFTENLIHCLDWEKEIRSTFNVKNPIEIRFTAYRPNQNDTFKLLLGNVIKDERVIYREIRYKRDTIHEDTYEGLSDYYHNAMELEFNLTKEIEFVQDENEEIIREETFKQEFIGEFLDVPEDKIIYLNYEEMLDFKIKTLMENEKEEILKLLEV